MGLKKGLRTLPPELKFKIENLGRRAYSEDVKEVILELCAGRSFRASELSLILNRKQDFLVRIYLTPMREQGLLEYTIPQCHFHADQAYRTIKSESKETD